MGLEPKIKIKCPKCGEIICEIASMWGGLQIYCPTCKTINDIRTNKSTGELFDKGKIYGFYEHYLGGKRFFNV